MLKTIIMNLCPATNLLEQLFLSQLWVLEFALSKHIKYYSNVIIHSIRKYQKNQIPFENSSCDPEHSYKRQVFDSSGCRFRVSGALENQNFQLSTMVAAGKKSPTFHTSAGFFNLQTHVWYLYVCLFSFCYRLRQLSHPSTPKTVVSWVFLSSAGVLWTLCKISASHIMS